MKKLLIIAIVALLAVPTLADPGMFIRGEIVTECRTEVWMKIPFFFTFVTQPDILWLQQDENGRDWSASGDWLFIFNHPLKLTATLDPTGMVGATGYYVGIDEPAIYPYTTSKDYWIVPPMALPPTKATVNIKLTDVAYDWPADTNVHVADLIVTLTAI
jgi:hypothetical protein